MRKRDKSTEKLYNSDIIAESRVKMKKRDKIERK